MREGRQGELEEGRKDQEMQAGKTGRRARQGRGHVRGRGRAKWMSRQRGNRKRRKGRLGTQTAEHKEGQTDEGGEMERDPPIPFHLEPARVDVGLTSPVCRP